MNRIGFDNDKYLSMQSAHIRERIAQFGDKLYLEFGGKLFDDYHASRVLPGFAPDSKLQMLLQLADQAEMIISINAADIERNKIRHDLGITYDQDDVNMIDPFHLEAYGETTVNYNRDIEIYPVLAAMFEGIYGHCPYKSPTDMGVNMAGNCIIDDEVCKEASRQEIIRRYYQSLNRFVKDEATKEEVYKQELIMKQAKITVNDRTVVPIANDLAKTDGAAAAALELPDGTIVTGSTSDLLGPASAVLLNAIKVLGHIDKHTHLISRTFIEPIQQLKTGYLGSHNPRLHTDEVLIALSMCAVSDPNAKLALEQLPKLSGCQLHVSAILSAVDINTFKKLGIELTNEAVYESVATN